MKTQPGQSISITLLNRHTGHEWVQEHKFCEGRRWRFDFACPFLFVAIEVEGGAFTCGRHTRGVGFINDLKKYNTALVLGWRVLRYTPEQFNALDWADDLTKLFRLEG